jgi:hypothetical protein
MTSTRRVFSTLVVSRKIIVDRERLVGPLGQKMLLMMSTQQYCYSTQIELHMVPLTCSGENLSSQEISRRVKWVWKWFGASLEAWWDLLNSL